MHRMTNPAPDAHGRSGAGIGFVAEFDFIPDALRRQCHSLVKTYHAMHGYSCLPNILWKAELASFIQKHRGLREALRKASTTRSARTANDYFALIATEALSLEVLARDYSNWSAMLPAAKARAIQLLDERTPPTRTWLMEHYLYPPRYDAPVAAMMPAPVAAQDTVDVHDGDVAEARSFRDIMLAHRHTHPTDAPSYPAAAKLALVAQTSSKA